MFDKLTMQTKDLTQENIKKLADLFPECVTESKDGDKTVHSVDFDVLKHILGESIVEGFKESYQFTWPGKLKSMDFLKIPSTKTLRPCREESVDFDHTKNLYIEGDNLEALKLLRETYLGKIKMIYIDPPYNTGNDFVYNDTFKITEQDYKKIDGNFSDAGDCLVTNPPSNGRFHTDWLNMMYPRLQISKDLLTEDGAIFISIDEHEMPNLKKICDEIFSERNYRNTILTRRRVKSLNSQFVENGLRSLNVGFEYVLIYSKSDKFLMNALRMDKNNASEKGRWDVFWSNADRPTMRYELLGFTPRTGQWRNSREKAVIAVENYRTYLTQFSKTISLEDYWKETGCKLEFIRRIPNATGKNGGVQHWVPPSNTSLRTSNWLDIEVSQIGKEIDLPFDNPKSKLLIMELIKLATNKDDTILDFFSGSATTAHAVFQLNKDENSKRKFILIQIPQKTSPESDACQQGYRTIADIGKERIRRAAKLCESSQTNLDSLIKKNDLGFRVLKLDSSNMNPVYYSPNEIRQNIIEYSVDNIKIDRTNEDLLFQEMIELGIDFSSSILKTEISSKEVFDVDNGYLIACFDENISDEVITEIAKKKPVYFVIRDSSLASDSVAINYEQIFKTYSPNTRTKVL